MSNKSFWLASVIIAGLLVFVASREVSSMWVLSAQQPGESLDIPVLDYETETHKIVGKERKQKNDRFNALGNPEKTKEVAELRAGTEPLPTNSHWWVGLPALPVSQSDAIVLGEVTEAEAHLSGDKTGIYSEFLVQVEEVFKESGGPLTVGDVLSVNRVGGGVRFASGKVQQYKIARQGMLHKGSRYVLFLRQTTDNDLLILTGYELSGGRVIPVDGEDIKDARSDLPFVLYRGADQSRLLQDLKAAILANRDREGVK
jgi:hypothetical protein